jgi:protein-disulfide isomerase
MMRKLPSLTLLFLLSPLLAFTIVGVPHSYAEGMTEEQATAILNELKQIRQLLERQQTRSAGGAAVTDQVSLAARDVYVLGSEHAKVTLVEFTDYQCPFCNKFHLNTFPELKKQFVDTGLVRFVSRDLPLKFHTHAFEAARAARCAGEQARYWEVRDWLSSHPDNLTNDAILSAATQTGVDGPSFQACLESDRHRADVQQDIADAKAIGITGTPGFVIGRSSNGILEGIKIVGAQSYEAFEAKINQQLSAAEKKP